VGTTYFLCTHLCFQLENELVRSFFKKALAVRKKFTSENPQWLENEDFYKRLTEVEKRLAER